MGSDLRLTLLKKSFLLAMAHGHLYWPVKMSRIPMTTTHVVIGPHS